MKRRARARGKRGARAVRGLLDPPSKAPGKPLMKSSFQAALDSLEAVVVEASDILARLEPTAYVRELQRSAEQCRFAIAAFRRCPVRPDMREMLTFKVGALDADAHLARSMVPRRRAAGPGAGAETSRSVAQT